MKGGERQMGKEEDGEGSGRRLDRGGGSQGGGR